MKTLKLIIFLGSIFAITAVFFACSPTPTTDPASLLPSLKFISPTNAVTQNDRYEEIKFHFTAAYNLNTTKTLTNVKMVASFTNPTSADVIILDSAVPAAVNKSIEIQENFTIPGTAPYGQVIKVTVSVEDINLKINTKVFTFTVTNLSDLNYYDVTMGAQSNVTLGSYFATDSGQVLLKGKALNNQGRVDFIYFFNESGDGNCIASPNNQVLFDNSDLVALFTTKNNTLFKMIALADPSDYDKIRSYEAIQQLYNSGTGNGTTYIPTITDGGGGTSVSYIVFKTAKIKFGIMKVIDIILGDGGFQTRNSVHLDVRVQK